MAFPRDVVTYCSRRVVDSRHDKAVVFGSEEVRSSSQPGLIDNGGQFTLGFGILKCKNESWLTCPKLDINTNFLVNIIQKTYKIKKTLQRKYFVPLKKFALESAKKLNRQDY